MYDPDEEAGTMYEGEEEEEEAEDEINPGNEKFTPLSLDFKLFWDNASVQTSDAFWRCTHVLVSE